MFDYSQMTPRAFEMLAKEYLETTYSGSSWTLTSASGDGNRDVVCSYRFLDQEFEYWAEAKFSGAQHPSKLQKGQLDPTLVSALLYPKQVSLKFISNNVVTENYIYRLTDFRLRTNIGVTLVLKDQFEEWLSKHPEIYTKYGIVIINGNKPESACPRPRVRIDNVLITASDAENGYMLERKLLQQQLYYLYLVIEADASITNLSIRFLQPEFKFLPGTEVLYSPEKFNLAEGQLGYKFCFMPVGLYHGKIPIALYVNEEVVARTELPEISVVKSQEYVVAYAQQSAYEIDLIKFIKEAGKKNKIAVVYGHGATGKSYLMTNLLHNLSLQYETAHYSFAESTAYNCLQLCRLLLFLNIGNMAGYSYKSIKESISRLVTPEKRLFLSELLTHIEVAPERCIEFMRLKQEQGNLRLLFSQASRSQKIIIIEDIHKLQSPVKELVEQLLREFIELENNQVVICTTRDKTSMIPNYSFSRKLNGLTKQDKVTTLQRYLNVVPDSIQFHRSTDNILVFANILSRLIDEQKNINQDILTFKTHIRLYCEHAEAENLRIFREHLEKYSGYGELVELVFWVGSGIPYQKLSELFPAEYIDLLIADRIFKLSGGKVSPIHDHYAAAFMEEQTIHDNTVKRLQTLMETDQENGVLYLSLLLNSNNTMFFSQLSLARSMRNSYFLRTQFYESYLLAQAIVSHIDFSESLSEDEVYDTFVLATSSFYQKSCDEVVSLYKQVLVSGERYRHKSHIWGILLRTKTELMNQYYWDLRLELLEAELEKAEKTFPKGHPNQDYQIRFACIHQYNRRMVFDLLQNRYHEACNNFEHCCQEARRLEQPASEGFAEMDYGKGLYIHDLEQALAHMEKALQIFRDLGTEHRRCLDCECEVAYLHCIRYGAAPEYIHALECSALALHEAHYDELYAKAKLKLAALYMNFGLGNHQEVENHIIEAEYVLPYRPCRRLEMLFSNIKAVHYMLSGQLSSSQRESERHLQLSVGLGDDYQVVAQNNIRISYATSASFAAQGLMNVPMMLLDPRIW